MLNHDEDEKEARRIVGLWDAQMKSAVSFPDSFFPPRTPKRLDNLQPFLAIDDDKKERRLEAMKKFEQGIGIDFSEYFDLFGSSEWPMVSC